MPRELSKKSPGNKDADESRLRLAELSYDSSALKTPEDFSALQRSAGNSAVGALLRRAANSSGATRSELNISDPDDPCEREASRVAEVMTGETGPKSDSDSFATDSEPHQLKPKPASGENSPASVGGGRPLPVPVRRSFESRLGTQLDAVRVHTDEEAQQTADDLGARAFTVGSDVVFAKGKYEPETARGQQLLAHELTHVLQQRGETTGDGPGSVTQVAAPQIQRSIFEDAWKGIQSAGRAVGGAVASAGRWIGAQARKVGSALSDAAEWVGERVRDAAMWVVNLIRDLPARLGRLATTLWEGLSGIVTFIPEAIRALASGGLKGLAEWLWERTKAGGFWVLRFLSRVFDVLGGPELLEFITHILTKARPLSGEEIGAGQRVLGPAGVRWGDVRVSQGGLLNLIFSLNNSRAFVTFHTINLPEGESIDVVVHELTHVLQYERTGSLYLGQALHAQMTRGGGAYNYGGPDGLVQAKGAGKHLRDFNREEQAQIAQDYYRYVIEGVVPLTDEQRQAYDHFVGELRAGEV